MATLSLAWITVLAGVSSAQAFSLEQGHIPGLAGVDVEEVDFVDIDLDGDPDVVLATGGEDSYFQNRCWVNLGGLQGGALGYFVDETDLRLPALYMSAHDVDAGDIDGDGDPDLHLSHSSLVFTNPGNRWWVNLGGDQGGESGYFADETAVRWVGLGQPGSSIPPTLLTGSGAFEGYCYDSDFADLDNDGDLDLVYTSYGGVGDGGLVDFPARIFLNDGEGYFQEFNPSGFQPPLGLLKTGNPGLWCEGAYQHDTVDATGAFCDPAARTQDVAIGDFDGDFDLDFVLGEVAETQNPRMFANRLSGSSLAPGLGTLGFRDVTGIALPLTLAGGSEGDLEIGDLDGDGDLDLYGTNEHFIPWFDDALVINDGQGFFSDAGTPAGSSSTDAEAEFVDYDCDGDLDVFVANWVSADRLYRNDGGLQLTQVALPALPPHPSKDVDASDVDADGDYDVLVSSESSYPDLFLLNVTEVPDTTAPRIVRVESHGDRTASAGMLSVRAAVLDNAPWYATATNDTALEIWVDGVVLPNPQAAWAGGELFRAELPANLVGAVTYRMRSADEHGNTGTSIFVALMSTFIPAFALPYGNATIGLAGGAPELRALSVPFAESTFHLALSSGAAGAPTIIAIATQQLSPGVTIPALLYLQIFGTPLLVAPGSLDSAGDQVLALPLGSLSPGLSVFAQGFVFDPTASGEALASSRGLRIITQ